MLYEIRFRNGNNSSWSCPNGFATRIISALKGDAHKDVNIIDHSLEVQNLVNQVEGIYRDFSPIFPTNSNPLHWESELKRILSERSKKIYFGDTNSEYNLPQRTIGYINNEATNKFRRLVEGIVELHTIDETILFINTGQEHLTNISNEVNQDNRFTTYASKVEEAKRRLTKKAKEYMFGNENDSRILNERIISNINATESFWEYEFDED